MLSRMRAHICAFTIKRKEFENFTKFVLKMREKEKIMADIALIYELSTDETYYIVAGTNGEGDTVNILDTYNGKSVKEIKA